MCIYKCVHTCTHTHTHTHTHLNLHLQVCFEGGEEGEKDAERELKHLRDTRHSIPAQSNTEVLLDGRYENIVRTENWTRVLQY